MKKLKGNNESFSFSSLPYISPFIPAEEYKWLNIKKGMTRKKNFSVLVFVAVFFLGYLEKIKKNFFLWRKRSTTFHLNLTKNCLCLKCVQLMTKEQLGLFSVIIIRLEKCNRLIIHISTIFYCHRNVWIKRNNFRFEKTICSVQ